MNMSLPGTKKKCDSIKVFFLLSKRGKRSNRPKMFIFGINSNNPYPVPILAADVGYDLL